MTDDAGNGVAGADRVDQHAHGDAAPCGIDQDVRKTQPDRIAVENIGLEDHAALGGGNRRDHRGVGFITGIQLGDRVRRRQRVVGYPVACDLQRGKPPAEAGGDSAGGCIEARMFQRFVSGRRPFRRDRDAPDSVDAGNRIEQRADQWRQENDADPANGRAHLVFRHCGMRGGDRRDQRRDDGEDMRPMGDDQRPQDG